MYISIYVYMYISIFVYCLDVYMYICIYVYMYIDIYFDEVITFVLCAIGSSVLLSLVADCHNYSLAYAVAKAQSPI